LLPSEHKQVPSIHENQSSNVQWLEHELWVDHQVDDRQDVASGFKKDRNVGVTGVNAFFQWVSFEDEHDTGGFE
jgi:hypothetical protein